MFTIITANPEPHYIDPTLRAPVSFHPIRALRRATATMSARRSPRPPSRPTPPTDMHRMRADFEARFTL